MEHYIAVDNVTAWPNLTLMPNGDIIATIFNQPTHGGWEGDVACWASEDGGKLWTLRGTPAVHEPTTNRMNVAAGLGHDDTLIVLASGWDKRPPKGQAQYGEVGQTVLPMWTCLSEDGGRTWTRGENVPLPGDASQRIIPFGDIVRLSDGLLGVCIYSWEPPNGHNAYFYTSADKGQSWRVCGTIRKGNTNETTPIALPDGRVLAVGRTLGAAHLDLFESTDGGKSWADNGPVTGDHEHPGHLLQLKDGRLLLSHGRRCKANNPFYLGLGYKLSTDGGRTWGRSEGLLESRHVGGMHWPHSDGGYPSSVQLADGTLVTAYYSSSAPGVHERYHMGVVRWLAE